jgi:hypothetical protein
MPRHDVPRSEVPAPDLLRHTSELHEGPRQALGDLPRHGPQHQDEEAQERPAARVVARVDADEVPHRRGDAGVDEERGPNQKEDAAMEARPHVVRKKADAVLPEEASVVREEAMAVPHDSSLVIT